jgi:hypothetical protein
MPGQWPAGISQTIPPAAVPIDPFRSGEIRGFVPDLTREEFLETNSLGLPGVRCLPS